jgi:hypothetical protein
MYFSCRFLYAKSQGTKRGILSGNGGNTSLSEHDFKDLKDVQDGIASCKSFHPQNRVRDGGQGGVASKAPKANFRVGLSLRATATVLYIPPP